MGDDVIEPGRRVSVVLPTYNRLDRLRSVLDALDRQTVPPYEVVVVSDGSSDGTDDHLRRAELDVTLRPVFQENSGPAVARNRGIDEARGDIVLFVDDDFVPADDLIERHLDAHARLTGEWVVIGPMLDPDDFEFSPWTAWEQAMLRKQYDAMANGAYEATPRQFYTANASVARRHLLDAGGFDPQFRRMEDVELGYRLADAGLGFHFAPECRGFHYAERSFESWLDIATAYGHNDVIFGRDHDRPQQFRDVITFFHERSAPIRALMHATVRSDLAHRAVVRLTAVGAAPLSSVSDRAGRALLSCAYNSAYYRGMADEVGGPAAFFRLARDAR